MKVAVYSSKDYDKKFLTLANEAQAPEHRHSLTFLEARLDDITATLAEPYDVICAFVNDEVTPVVLDKCKDQNIGLIALRSAGCNNVDLEYLAKKELSLVHVPAYSPQAVAEHALALLLTLSRKTHKVYNRVRDGNFSLEGVTPGFVMHSKTVGVLGTGKIGECFVRIMMGMGCTVLGYDAFENPALQALQKAGQIAGWGSFEYKPLDEVLAASDIISMHLPLTPQTHGLINEASIAKMKKGVVLLNTSRGALVDSQAVIQALKTKHIGGIGLDTYEEEEEFFYRNLSEEVVGDDQLIRLMTFPNVIITPHQGFYTREALTAIAESTISSITEYARGTQPGPSIIYKGKVIKQMQSGGGKKSPKAAQGGPTATAGGQMEEAHCKCSGAHA